MRVEGWGTNPRSLVFFKGRAAGNRTALYGNKNAPCAKAHADTHRRARVACPSPRRARYKFVRELQKGGRKGEREKEREGGEGGEQV